MVALCRGAAVKTTVEAEAEVVARFGGAKADTETHNWYIAGCCSPRINAVVERYVSSYPVVITHTPNGVLLSV